MARHKSNKHKNFQIKAYSTFRVSLLLTSTFNVRFLPLINRNTRGDPKTPEFIDKKLCIYSYTFQLQSPSNYSPFDAVHHLRCFFHCSKQFLNLLTLMPFSAFAVSCFTSSTCAHKSPIMKRAKSLQKLH